MQAMVPLILISLLIALVTIIGMWKVFTKAGKPGWASIIPIYNLIVLLEIAGRPLWWFVLLLIPFVNFIVILIIFIDVAKSFGQGTGFGLGLALLGPIFFPILGFGSARYVGTRRRSCWICGRIPTRDDVICRRWLPPTRNCLTQSASYRPALPPEADGLVEPRLPLGIDRVQIAVEFAPERTRLERIPRPPRARRRPRCGISPPGAEIVPWIGASPLIGASLPPGDLVGDALEFEQVRVAHLHIEHLDDEACACPSPPAPSPRPQTRRGHLVV